MNHPEPGFLCLLGLKSSGKNTFIACNDPDIKFKPGDRILAGGKDGTTELTTYQSVKYPMIYLNTVGLASGPTFVLSLMSLITQMVRLGYSQINGFLVTIRANSREDFLYAKSLVGILRSITSNPAYIRILVTNCQAEQYEQIILDDFFDEELKGYLIGYWDLPLNHLKTNSWGECEGKKGEILGYFNALRKITVKDYDGIGLALQKMAILEKLAKEFFEPLGGKARRVDNSTRFYMEYKKWGVFVDMLNLILLLIPMFRIIPFIKATVFNPLEYLFADRLFGYYARLEGLHSRMVQQQVTLAKDIRLEEILECENEMKAIIQDFKVFQKAGFWRSKL